ncbi:MAG: glycosyltransferase family 1 protein [Bryobacteraceae bacterium]|jgi:glycosyltransferase involved in cell wall biosynthesis
MALHILIDARRAKDFGIGTYIRGLVRGLGLIDSTNCYTLVASPEEGRALGELPPNFHLAAYTRPDDSPWDNLLFPMFVRRLKPDLVHVPLNRVPLWMPQPYVVTIHDMANLLFESEHSHVRLSLRRWRFRRGLARASFLIAVSDATRRDVESTVDVPPGRIRRIYNAPDPEFAAGAASPSTEHNGRVLERYQVNYPYLLYAGNIRVHKNIPRLVEAFAVLREQLSGHPEYRDLHLILIGDTIARNAAVRQAVFRSRISHLVRFLGFVPSDTLRCFYQSAAAFVFPSRYEGFGLPPLEAMACGTPVVASNVSSLPEVLGDAAMLVNPENVFDIARGIRDVLVDPSMRCALVQKGFAQVARFSWRDTARQVLEIYREVAAHEHRVH